MNRRDGMKSSSSCLSRSNSSARRDGVGRAAAELALVVDQRALARRSTYVGRSPRTAAAPRTGGRGHRGGREPSRSAGSARVGVRSRSPPRNGLASGTGPPHCYRGRERCRRAHEAAPVSARRRSSAPSPWVRGKRSVAGGALSARRAAAAAPPGRRRPRAAPPVRRCRRRCRAPRARAGSRPTRGRCRGTGVG